MAIPARKLVRALFNKLGMNLQRTAPNQIRGIDPIKDIAFLIERRTGITVVDVGANDGDTVAAFLEAFPGARIVAVEPFDESCAKLSARFLKNGNVQIANVALGEKPGHAQLNLYSSHRMNSLLELSDQPDNLMKGYEKQGVMPVRIDTVDNFARASNIDFIDVLKVDTQGYDLNVLRGAGELLQNKRIKVVFLEVNFIPMYSRQASFVDLHACLSSFGYRLVDFYNHVWKNGHTVWCDACYVAPTATR